MNLQDACRLLDQLMLQFDMYELGWHSQMDHAKKRFGQCSYHDKTISLSRPLTELNSEADVKDTILHEIAHALVGPGHNHDIHWQRKAMLIGANPIRCYDASIIQPRPKYIGKCVTCGYEIFKYKLTRRISQGCWHTTCRRAGKPADIIWRKP